jgi:hypothetical protein
MNWHGFATVSPELACAGERLLTKEGGVAIGFLATVHRRLHLAPVCPIFCAPGLYLSVGASTPKRRDLDRDARYVLHAFLAPNDEEFRVSGRGVLVGSTDERARVHAAIRFGAFGRDDPIYELDITESMWGYWENVGRPGTRPVRRLWRAPGESA